MVRFGVICAFLLISYALSAANPMLTAEVDPNLETKLGYMEGKISIYHSRSQRVDPKSFQMEEKPLAVEFLFDARLSTDERTRYPQYTESDLVSIYRFHLERKPKGLYLLPAVTVEVDGKRIQSIPSTYTITYQESAASLTLETVVDPDEPLYPGQRARLGYRITFNEPTALVKEELPLFKAPGFTKIGQEDITTNESELYTTQIIRQEVRAQSPGTYSFPESVIEGYTFREDLKGQPIYLKPLKATVPPLTVVVNAFPEEGKPVSFSGSLGQFTMDIRLLTAGDLLIGDTLRFLIRVTGQGEFDTVQVPDISCQPGFSGFFQMSDVPPKEKTDAISKEFTLEIRPLSTQIHALPSVEFAFFDPYAKKYVVLKSQELAIRMVEPKSPLPTEIHPVGKSLSIKKQDWSRWVSQPQRSDLLLPSLPQLKELTSANASYREGETAKNLLQQEKAFNKALQLYLNLQDSHNSTALNDMIGNTFYQLGRHGWAIFYYQRALALEPRNASIRQHMALAEDKLGLAHQQPLSWLSFRESLQLCLAALLIFLLALSLKLRRPVSLILGILTLLLFGQAFYRLYGMPLKAVVVRSSTLDEGNAKHPLLEGQTVDVIHLSDDGRSALIKTADGKVGSVAYSFIRVEPFPL